MEKKRVLVADDDAEICDLLNKVLSDEGFDVVCVGDGEEADKMIKAEYFDLVILDVNMPKIDGYHVAYKITTQSGGPVPKVIILSCRNVKNDDDMGRKCGADIQLEKPIELSDLLAKVKELLPS